MITASFFGNLPAAAQINVLTYHNNLARTGLNANETHLTLDNVNTNTFARLFSYAVDGQVYTQPLYVSGVVIPGQGTRNVFFVATQHNTVYAFDADSRLGPTGGRLWQTSLGPSAATPNSDFGNRYGGFRDVHPEVGVTSTPVIDLASGTIYVEAFTHEGSAYFHRLHALNITNGTERPFSPVTVSASIAANGAGSIQGVLSFDARQQIQRCALTLAGGVVYLAFSGYADTDPYHGWVIGYRASDLKPLPEYVFNTSPNSSVADFGTNAGEGGIWMGGCGLSADAQTNLYLSVGNGIFNADTNGTEYGDSVLRLSTSTGLKATDYFTPFNQEYLSDNDVDLGSGGAVVLPDEVGSAAHPHLLVVCGKEGRLYLLDRDSLGHYDETGDHQVVQMMPGVTYGTWGSGAYFNHQIYFQPVNDVLRAYAFANGLLNPSPTSFAPRYYGYPGATPSISANGTNDGIVWAVQTDGSSAGMPAILHAYPATNLWFELYNSSQAGSQDALGPAVKFAVPTIANGKVYVGANREVTVFGLATILPLPTIAPGDSLFTNSITVTISNPTPNTSVYYTVDGSRPTSDSNLYTGPLKFTNSTVLTVRAIGAGTAFSRITSASFINTGSSSVVTNFLRQDYFPGQTTAALLSQLFPVMPTSMQYIGSFESTSNSASDYVERVSGYFIPPNAGDYVFFLCSDDESDLYLSTDENPTNKHVIARETFRSDARQWTSSSGGSDLASKRSDQFAGSAWPGGHTITLAKGKRYYLEGVHHQNGSATDFSATFKIAGEPDPVNGDASRLTNNVIAADYYDNCIVRITAPPADTFGVLGGAARFAVSATMRYIQARSTALPPINYQWQAAPAGSVVFTNIAGATNSSYSKSALTTTLNGAQFRVVLTSAGSSVTSPAATLTIGKAPVILARPANLSRGTGTPVVFTVNATGTGPLSYHWFKNQVDLSGMPGISGASGPSLTISNLQFSDGGSYTVVINNAFGSVTNSPAATLTVTDQLGPKLVILSHTNLQCFTTNKITLAGTASDSGLGDHGISSVKVNGAQASGGTASGTGTANWSQTITLANGTNTVSVVGTDGSRNSTTSLLRLILDTTRPVVAITSPAANQRWSNSVFTVKGTAKDNLGVTNVWYQNGGVWKAASSTNAWTNWTGDASLAAGTNIVSAYSEDWLGNRSMTNSVSFVFVVPAPLVVQMTGQGTLTPNYNNAMLEVGRSYAITPTAARGYIFSNWVQKAGASGASQTPGPKLTFMMQTNLVLQANFIPNPFPVAAGLYQGLFYDTNGVAYNSSGFLSATVTSNGVFSAKLQQGKSTYTLSGQFSPAGAWSSEAAIAGAKTTVGLQVDLSGGDFLSGQLSNGMWNAELWGNRNVYSKTNPAALAGKYSLALAKLEPGAEPANAGSGAFTVDTNGGVAFTGTLADGTKVTQSSFLSSQNQWPLYLSLYSGTGVLLGWVTVTNGGEDDVDGFLSWIKLTTKSGTQVRPGFTNAVDAAGSRQ